MIIRCDVGSEIGWGHFNRCVILAENLAPYFEVTFIVKSNYAEKIKNLLTSRFNHIIIPDFINFTDELKYYPEDQKFVILDISYIKNLRKTEELTSYFKLLLQHGLQILYIDGDGDERLKMDGNPLFLAYIQPYMHVESRPRVKAQFWLAGIDYLLVNPLYFVSKIDRQNLDVTNFLVTLGGSDPQWITKDVLNGISLTNHQSKLFKIVIGPSFSQELVTLLQERSSIYNIELIYAPVDLLDLYKWAHLCIGASSTSRFEAAVCGLPMLFVSLYPEHEVLSKNYGKLGFSIYLGNYRNMTPESWASNIESYYLGNELYVKMLSNLNQKSFSGLGPQKLANRIYEICRSL